MFCFYYYTYIDTKHPEEVHFLYPDLSFLQCPCFQDEEEQEKAAKKSMALQKAMEVKEVSPMSAANISIAA